LAVGSTARTKRLYPAADEEIVIEYMRKIAKAPIEEEYRTGNWRTIKYDPEQNS
jgi:hypothetical protein